MAKQTAIVIADDTPEIYANFLQVFITEWDFLLILGSTHLATDEANKLSPTARADVLVRMSPQHAKAAVVTLGGLVAEYEKKHGPISGGPDRKGAANGDGQDTQPTSPRRTRRRNPDGV